MRVLRVPVLDRIVAVFISFFRGTPLLVQQFLFYFGLPQIVPAMTGIDGVTAAIIGLTLHFSRPIWPKASVAPSWASTAASGRRQPPSA